MKKSKMEMKERERQRERDRHTDRHLNEIAHEGIRDNSIPFGENQSQPESTVSEQ